MARKPGALRIRDRNQRRDQHGSRHRSQRRGQRRGQPRGESRIGRARQGRMWAENVAPLVTATRAGASHAARTAGRERILARRQAWWRRRWLLLTVAGMGISAAVAGVYAGMAGRSGKSGGPDSGGRLRSSVEAGKERMTDAARTMADKVRGGNGASSGSGASSGNGSRSRPDVSSGSGAKAGGMRGGAMGSATPDPATGPERAKGDAPATGTGYSRPR